MSDSDYELVTLPNGLRLVWMDMPQAHDAYVGAYVRGGSAYEEAGSSGVSHLLEHLHLATTRSNPRRLDMLRALDALPGHWNASSAREMLVFWFQTSALHVTPTLELLGEVLAVRPDDDDCLDPERALIVSELYKDSPSLTEQMLGDHFGKAGFGLPPAGTTKSVKRLGQDCVSRFDGLFFDARRVVLVAAGRLDSNGPSAVAPLLESMEIGTAELPVPPSRKTRTLPRVKSLSAPTSGSHVLINFFLDRPRSTREDVALYVLALRFRIRVLSSV